MQQVGTAVLQSHLYKFIVKSCIHDHASVRIGYKGSDRVLRPKAVQTNALLHPCTSGHDADQVHAVF